VTTKGADAYYLAGEWCAAAVAQSASARATSGSGGGPPFEDVVGFDGGTSTACISEDDYNDYMQAHGLADKACAWEDWPSDMTDSGNCIDAQEWDEFFNFPDLCRGGSGGVGGGGGGGGGGAGEFSHWPTHELHVDE
jgi:hypothetical protein